MDYEDKLFELDFCTMLNMLGGSTYEEAAEKAKDDIKEF